MKLTKSELKEMIKEVIQEEKINEVDFEKTTIPADVKRFMNRFINTLKGANLNKVKQVSVLGQVIKALGISQREFNAYIQRIKRGL